MFKFIADRVVSFIGKVNWEWLKELFTGRYYSLKSVDHKTIKEMLTNDYYIILTRRNTHLSTYAINFSHFILTGNWGYYSHALMNLEDEVKDDDDFRLIEATKASGVAFSPFDHVFDCDSVALLRPKNLSIEKWTAALDAAKTFEGRTYDTLYDLKDTSNMSCVELVREALRSTPGYATDFANFERMIADAKNLDPHMFYECEDFEVAFEIRR